MNWEEFGGLKRGNSPGILVYIHDHYINVYIEGYRRIHLAGRFSREEIERAFA